MNEKSNDNNLISLSFARLPILNSKRNLWGYELVYLSPEGNLTINPEYSDAIAVDLASSTYMALQQIMGRVKKIMVNFSQKNIFDNLPYALPQSRTAVKISNPLNISGSVLELLKQLKDDGYQIAVCWVHEHQTCASVFHLADIICLNIDNKSLPDISAIFKEINQYDASVLANFVDDQTRFDVCLRAGFSLFQGSFFKQPEDLSIKKMLPGTISRFKLMELIEQDDPDFSKLAKTIQTDVAVSFRLLSYMNSAAFGFRQKIESIKDAIAMLSWRNLKNWLRIVLLTEVAKNQNASELIFLSAQRGKFLEQVALDHDFWGFKPDSLFLLGMFSFLDAILNQEMAKIVKYLPLADKLKGALCVEDNNEYVPLLKLAQCFEETKFKESEAMINQLGLDAVKVKRAYYGSIEWANKLCEMQS